MRIDGARAARLGRRFGNRRSLFLRCRFSKDSESYTKEGRFPKRPFGYTAFFTAAAWLQISPLVLRVFQPGKKRSENFDAVPEILETQIFVRGVLVVVVVGNWENDDWRFACLFKEMDRQTAA